tara:strand:- start:2361 stop:2525 length:165 start_codon:yes stop_codon:yes gene_type:complete
MSDPAPQTEEVKTEEKKEEVKEEVKEEKIVNTEGKEAPPGVQRSNENGFGANWK